MLEGFFPSTAEEIENILTSLFPVSVELLLLRCRTNIIYMKRTFIDREPGVTVESSSQESSSGRFRGIACSHKIHTYM